jgi:glucose-1-phosphate thymidylyltransferase
MKIIIPMAGRGSRLRPHTLTVPKPLIPIAGKTMVQRLVEDIAAAYKGKIEEVAYITGDFGKEVEKDLKQIAKSIGAKGTIYYQDKPLGVGHAILCAKKSLHGNMMIAFADTLFKADFTFDGTQDGVIWVQKVKNPASFGVVQLDESGTIVDFVEKPTTFVSDLAIVGIYYFRDGDQLRDELQYLIDHDIKDKGEYQLTSALETMRAKGTKFKTAAVEEWLDCGNKDAVIHSNRRMLDFNKDKQLVAASAKITNSVVIPPCFIGENVQITNSVVGPHVSLGNNVVIENSVISNSILQHNTKVAHANFSNSMIGSMASVGGKPVELNLGDYSEELRR